MPSNYDLAIVGASFSGLACAKSASLLGLKTVVIDRKPDSGAVPHTTGILVKEVAEEWDLPRKFTRKIKKVRLYSPSFKSIDLFSPNYYFLATDVSGLLKWFADEATAHGANFLYNTEFRGANRKDNALIEIAGANVHSNFLVGADGPRSKVAETFNLGKNNDFLVGVEAEYEGLKDIDEDCLHVFLDSELAPGYIAWAVPSVGVTQIGLACLKETKPQLELFVEKLSKIFDFSKSKVVSRRGGLIPIGGTVRPYATDKVVLVGDAAGLVSPLTAGGIHNSIHSGQMAAQQIANHLLDEGADPSYYLNAHYPNFLWKSLLRKLINVGPPNWLYDGCIENPLLRKFAQLVFFHNRGLFSPKAWTELALGNAKTI